MKVFQDRGQTILPRIDFLFLLSRFLILAGTAWIIIYSGLDLSKIISLAIMSVTYLATMALFWWLIKQGTRNLKTAYLSLIIFDLIFCSLLITQSGGFHSNFYLLYYPIIMFSAYLLTFSATLLIVGVVSVTYMYFCVADISFGNSLNMAIRVGLLWFFAFAISFVSEHVRRSEKRLLKLLDTLNQRTAELEKSQAHLEMIYDNSRILGGILDIDGVIEGVMKIIGELLYYPASGILLRGGGDNFVFHGRNIGGRNNFHLKAVENTKSRLIRKVAQQTEPILVIDISDRNDYAPLLKKTRSVILVPMETHGKVAGILLAESPQAGAFTDKDQKILSVVARSAAMALENASLHKRMEELTITDDLTGIYNYRYFARKLKEEQRRAARYDLPLSLIMLDIDHFKRFNDTYGHEIGNLVLKGITSIVNRCIRDVDIFARYGGEEFVVILPQTPQVEVTKIGERIREQVENAVFGGFGGVPELKVTISVGISSFPENGRPHDELLSVVDQALYRAKGSGRNVVCVI